MVIIKKIFKWIGILLLSVLAIILISTIVLIIRNRQFIGTADKLFVDYLKHNKIILNNNAYDTEKQLFDEDTYASNLILLGESHGLADVQTIDKFLFLHLNQKTGLRYYVAEMDSIRANMLNHFLYKTEKDTVLLKQVVLAIKQRIPQQSSMELYQKWLDIYDYNQTLPDSQKIAVIGIDTDFNIKSSIPRDSAMVLNFKNIITEKGLESEQFYGLFGLFHVLQNGINSTNFKPFAARLISNNLNVKSILCINIDSEVYFPENNQYPTPPSEKIGFLNMDGPIILAQGINDLKKASERNTCTLFNITKENSPYFKSKKLITSKSNFINQPIAPYDKNLSTPDFVQYVILIRNSQALTPIK